MTNRSKKYLHDIATSARDVQSAVAGLTIEAFLADPLRLPATLWHLTVIGEAIARLESHAPDVVARITSYRQIIRFRNHLVHEYDDINDAILWQVTQEHLGVLVTEVEALLAE